MAAAFENPMNGYRERVGWGPVIGVGLCGALYFVFRGMWRHVLGYLLLVPLGGFLCSLALGSWSRDGGSTLSAALMFTGLLLPHLIYAGIAPELVKTKYLRDGWRPV